MAEVIRPAAVAAFPQHHIEPAGGEAWELRQRLADERQIAVNLGPSPRPVDFGEAGLADHPQHRVAVDAQLRRYGPGTPFLDVVIAQNLRFEVRGDGHFGFLHRGYVAGPHGGEENRGEPAPNTDVRTNGIALVSERRRSGIGFPPPSGRPAADHPLVTEVNPYASLSLFGLGSGVAGQHGRGAHAGCPGSAGRHVVARHAARGLRNRGYSNGGHGRNGYRSKPASGSVGKNIDDHSPALLQTPAGQPASPQAAVDERRQSVNNPPAFVPRTV